MAKPVVPFLRTPYNYDTNQASDESGLHCKDKSLAQQHLAEETDINHIIETYTRTGILPTHNRPPLQGDFTTATSFQDALDLIVKAREAFQEQPAAVRARFGNDPAKFVEFCGDENNAEEMRKMGLMSDSYNQKWDKYQADQAELVKAGRAAKAAEKSSQATPDKKGVT